MVTNFLKKIIPGKNSSDPNGLLTLVKPKKINLDTNNKSSFNFSPLTPKNLIGRDADINEIVHKKGQTRFLIIGDQQFPGIGKTAFSLRLAKKLAANYPGKQVYIDLKPNRGRPISSIEAMAQVIWHFKIQCKIEDSEEKLRKAYLDALVGKKIILILDGVTKPMEVLKLLPPKDCLMIVVSQDRITLPGFYRKSMKPLEPESAQNLLLLHAPNTKEKAKEIANFCEFNPMTLCIAGGLLASSKSITEQSLLEKMKQWDEGSVLNKLIALSFADLEKNTSKVFTKLAIFNDSFDAKAQDFICQDENNKHLTKLVNRQLVIFNEKTQRYQLHQKIKNFLKDHLKGFEKSDAEKRHATHFMIRLQSLQAKLEEKNSSSIHNSVNNFDSDWENYQTAQGWALKDLGSTEEGNHLCASFPENGAQFLKWRLPPKKCIEWFNSGLSAAKHLEDSKAELRQIINLSEATFESKDFSKAKELHEESLTLALEMGDDSNATMLLDKLAFFQKALNKNTEAIEYYEKALEIFKKTDDKEGQIKVLLKIAAIDCSGREDSMIISYLKQALVLAEQTGSHQDQIKIISNMGKVFFKSKNYSQAKEQHDKALGLARKFDSRYEEAMELYSISLCMEKLGNIGEAIRTGGIALEIFKALKKKEAKIMHEKIKSWKIVSPN